jgi:hypothetical protein
MQGKDQEFTALARFSSFTLFIGIFTNLDWALTYFIDWPCQARTGAVFAIDYRPYKLGYYLSRCL